MRKLKEINVCHLTEFFLIIKHSLVVAAAAWQRRRRWRWHGVGDSGSSLGVTWQWRWQHDYKTDNEAELMEENFGDKGEDDNAFGG